MYELRNYQFEAVNKGLEVLLHPRPRKGLIVAPVAAGKSLYVAYIAKQLGKPLICLQPSKELLEQNYKKFTDLGGEATIYSASVGKKELSNLTFATIQSLKAAKSEVIKMGIKHVIVDEAHLATKEGSTFRDFIKDCGITHILGLTATPIYLDNGAEGTVLKMMTKSRKSIFKNIDYITQISELVEKGFWAKLKYKVLQQNDSFLEVNSSGSEYKEEAIKLYYKENSLQEKIEEEVKNLINEGRKSILVFVPSIDEAEQLKYRIKGSAVIHSKLNKTERDYYVESFKALQTSVIINVGVLLTGFDHPKLDGIVMARPTMSISLWYQALGRAVRIHPEKKDSIIIDLSNNFSKFGRIEDLYYEYIEDYGWGLFKGEDLITGFPIKSQIRPKKKKLGKPKLISVSAEEEVMHFGKYKGEKLVNINKKNKPYLLWLINNQDFNWGSERLQQLKRNILEVVGLN